MYKFKEEIKNITLMDTPETDEATELLNKKISQQKQTKLILFLLTSVTIVSIFISITVIFKTRIPFILSSIFTFIMIIVDFKILSSFSLQLLPYRQLLKIAKRNDEIRHEERIRESERKRINGFNRKPRIIEEREINKTLNK